MAVPPVPDSLSNWATIISGLGSLMLSGLLVYIYFRQNSILENQRELFQHELNREVRQQHTEVLRDRVQIWLGENEPLGQNDRFDLREDNLPSVSLTRVHSAPDQPRRLIPDEESFSVYPESLRDDRYLEDFLNNHAPDVQEQVDVITSDQRQFSRLKSEFLSNIPPGETRETDRYRIEPTRRYPEWLFERVVRLERTEEDDKAYLKSIAEKGVRETTGAADATSIKYHGDPTDTSPFVYTATVKGIDRAELDEQEREDIEDEIVDILQQAIEAIDSGNTYAPAREAADCLDALDEEIHELKMLLIEYEGKPLYAGECEYLESAMV